MVIGLLCDAAQVVPAGRPFIRSLRDAMSRLKAANHITRLDQGCKADLAWWHTYIETWNGTGLFPAFLMVPLLPLMPLAPGELELSFLWTTPGSRFNGPTHGPQPILLQGAPAHCRCTGYMGAPLSGFSSHSILRQLRSCAMPRDPIR